MWVYCSCWSLSGMMCWCTGHQGFGQAQKAKGQGSLQRLLQEWQEYYIGSKPACKGVKVWCLKTNI